MVYKKKKSRYNLNIKKSYFASEEELLFRKDLINLFKNSPIPDNEILSNLNLYDRRQNVLRTLFFNEIYKRILNLPGVIIEFGCRWGKNMALLHSLRGIYEPFNQSRMIVGFDTFEGFQQVSEEDGKANIIEEGAYSVTKDYEKHLEEVFEYHEKEAPLSAIKKYEIIKGDVTLEVDKYFNKNPETIISLAIFDLDLYKPTKKCLKEIQPHLIKGSILLFDELNMHEFPGETLALKETFGLTKYKIERLPFSSGYQACLIIE